MNIYNMDTHVIMFVNFFKIQKCVIKRFFFQIPIGFHPHLTLHRQQQGMVFAGGVQRCGTLRLKRNVKTRYRGVPCSFTTRYGDHEQKE